MGAYQSSTDEVTRRLDAAWSAREAFGSMAPHQRAECLRAVANALDASRDMLVTQAMAESHLGRDRLVGEVGRTTFQLRLFADVVDEGSFLRVCIDRADPQWPPGPRPELRRMMVPLGPVVVFAASNFPFAFSVAGGDTASALAAGCPVVLKAHPGHPVLSDMTAELVSAALLGAGAPPGTFGLIHGDDAGRAAVTSEVIAAGAFTGSLGAGRALFDLAAARPRPIPFFAEMGSLNPVFVTRQAMAARGTAILAEYATSFTLSAGQFCTKPGLLFIPAGSIDDAGLADALLAHQDGAPLLNGHIQEGFVERLHALQGQRAVRSVVVGDRADATSPTPSLLATSAATVIADPDAVLFECFGPASVVVDYASDAEALRAAEAFGGQLTATVHGEANDDQAEALVGVLADRAGRVIWNGWPTGVSVTEAMVHGGPYPATTAPSSTSVGTAAIERFLRPVAFQSLPDRLLPPALQDANPLALPRRVNGAREGA